MLSHVRLTLLPVLALLIVLASALASWADIDGAYYVYGRNADGSAYSGTATLVPLGGAAYRVDWSVGTSYSGQGLLEGRVLTVEWGATDPAVYVVMPDGELHGTWADGAGLELMRRTPR